MQAQGRGFGVTAPASSQKDHLDLWWWQENKVSDERAIMKEMQSAIHNFCLLLCKLKVEPALKA